LTKNLARRTCRYASVSSPLSRL